MSHKINIHNIHDSVTQRSDAINNQLKIDERMYENTVKILLLGAIESRS